MQISNITCTCRARLKLNKIDTLVSQRVSSFWVFITFQFLFYFQFLSKTFFFISFIFGIHSFHLRSSLMYSLWRVVLLCVIYFKCNVKRVKCKVVKCVKCDIWETENYNHSNCQLIAINNQSIKRLKRMKKMLWNGWQKVQFNSQMKSNNKKNYIKKILLIIKKNVYSLWKIWYK